MNASNAFESKVKDLGQHVEVFCRERPFSSVFAAFGIGIALGATAVGPAISREVSRLVSRAVSAIGEDAKDVGLLAKLTSGALGALIWSAGARVVEEELSSWVESASKNRAGQESKPSAHA